MSDSEHSTVTYTSVSFPVEDDSDIGSPGVDGPPIMPEDPYAYIMAAYEVPPSPDYIPGPEVHFLSRKERTISFVSEILVCVDKGSKERIYSLIMYQDSWDKMIHIQCNARYAKLEKETQIKISNLEECVRIKDRQHIFRANDDFIIFENLRAQVNELQSQNEILKSKVVDCTMCQNLQVQVQELKSVNESLNLSVEELSKACILVEATLRERDEMISAQCEKM
ncbi:hypothetical protein Tco_0847589 [Tanacetum coccineum]